MAESLGKALEFAKFRAQQIKIFKAGRKADPKKPVCLSPLSGASRTQQLIQERYQAMLAEQDERKRARRARARQKAKEPKPISNPNFREPVYFAVPGGIRSDSGVYRYKP